MSLVGARHITAAKSQRFNGKRNCQFGATKIAIELITNQLRTISYALATVRAASMHVKAIAVRTVKRYILFQFYVSHPFENGSFDQQVDH